MTFSFLSPWLRRWYFDCRPLFHFDISFCRADIAPWVVPKYFHLLGCSCGWHCIITPFHFQLSSLMLITPMPIDAFISFFADYHFRITPHFDIISLRPMFLSLFDVAIDWLTFRQRCISEHYFHYDYYIDTLRFSFIIYDILFSSLMHWWLFSIISLFIFDYFSLLHWCDYYWFRYIFIIFIISFMPFSEDIISLLSILHFRLFYASLLFFAIDCYAFD